MNEIAKISKSPLTYYQRKNILTGACYEELIDDLAWEFCSAASFFQQWDNYQTLTLIHKYRTVNKIIKKLDEKMNEQFSRDSLIKTTLLIKSIRKLMIEESLKTQDFSLIYNQNNIVQKIVVANSAISKDDIKTFLQSLIKHKKDILDFCSYIQGYIDFYENKIGEKRNYSSLSLAVTNEKLEASEFALFCSILHQSGIFKMQDDEAKKSFCQRVSERFGLSANDEKARQVFKGDMDIKFTDRAFKKMERKIFPYIGCTTVVKIYQFLFLKFFSNLNFVQRPYTLNR